ncbi:hypothetical protein CALCODRAFT_8645 [Calocera cornea HHB12733]|uniref:Uncharacterized protein n=1 Tax=Calocera cornea HHB12733 TaxID=1353952 RepID=A0A165J4U1_9BASI|nr:hypothetical protein CALCODRAFT_8645 [Calocera cornea HHB12733]
MSLGVSVSERRGGGGRVVRGSEAKPTHSTPRSRPSRTADPRLIRPDALCATPSPQPSRHIQNGIIPHHHRVPSVDTASSVRPVVPFPAALPHNSIAFPRTLPRATTKTHDPFVFSTAAPIPRHCPLTEFLSFRTWPAHQQASISSVRHPISPNAR